MNENFGEYKQKNPKTVRNLENKVEILLLPHSNFKKLRNIIKVTKKN